jgi:agmatine/peptidylarginine deiminase
VTQENTKAQTINFDFNYYPRRAVDDAVPSNLEATFPGWERVSVPVYNEGGNFMSNGRMECLMTTRVTDANARKFHPDDIILDAAGVRDMYSRYAGCSQTHIFPRMPSEGTGHIDMWGKFLTDDDVIVGRITSERMTRFAAGAEEAELVRNVAAYLDERAEELAELGYKVHRVPMPLPSSNVFRSYTNSLLLNGTAFVPRYGGDGKDQVSPYGEKWSEEYEAEVVSIYGKLGFQVQWVDSDELIESGGAVHCVTMQFGKLP